jgi:hypothetical protein
VDVAGGDGVQAAIQPASSAKVHCERIPHSQYSFTSLHFEESMQLAAGSFNDEGARSARINFQCAPMARGGVLIDKA